MEDNRNSFEIAIDFAKKDYEYYSERNDERRSQAAEITIEALCKTQIPIQLKTYYKEGVCPICDNENEYGLYCSECGQRINEERIKHKEEIDEQTTEKKGI